MTNSELKSIESANLPRKSNFHGRIGIEAITGKSNFDIAEWMLIKLLQSVSGQDAMVALLCKTAVARRVLLYAWNSDLPIREASIHRIETERHFDAAADAGFFVCRTGCNGDARECQVYESMTASAPKHSFGFANGKLIARLDSYRRVKHLEGESRYRWRSGIKHDCAKVMELDRIDGRYRNGLGDLVELEPEFLYPMLKSSDVAKGTPRADRWMLVTQRTPAQATSVIRERAPKTWKYLQKNSDRMRERRSSIYRTRPDFAIFGVGEYAFAPWKVAIAALYKRLDFAAVGPKENRPTVLDDTCCFIPCASEVEAHFLRELLHSEPARQFYDSQIFWDAKRPITIKMLRRLDLSALAEELGVSDELAEFVKVNPLLREQRNQTELFDPIQLANRPRRGSRQRAINP